MSVDKDALSKGDRHATAAPPQSKVHSALLLAHIVCGGGAIVGKFGLHGGNPVLFALVREIVAGLALCLINLFLGGKAMPATANDIKLVVAAGACIFANHLFFVLGLKLTDPISGAAWQPAQPIVTAGLAIALGYEGASVRKLAGILLSVSGAMFMVLYGKSAVQSGNVSIGHLLFFCNCAAASGYVIISKRLLKRYPVASVSGWSYIAAGAFMFTTTAIVNGDLRFLELVCDDENMLVKSGCMDGAWTVPPSMVFPLVYYIIGNSLGAYFAITWANQYANPSIVSAYTVAQPLTSSFIAAMLVTVGGAEWALKYGLRTPGPQDLGVVAIVGGLSILFREESRVAASFAQKSEDGDNSADNKALGSQFINVRKVAPDPDAERWV